MTEWIPWDGGIDCPIEDPSQEVEVIFRSGASCTHICSDLFWDNAFAPYPNQIFFYRLIEKEQSDLDWLEGEVAKLIEPAPALGETLKEAWTLGQNHGFDRVQKLIRDRKEAKS